MPDPGPPEPESPLPEPEPPLPEPEPVGPGPRRCGLSLNTELGQTVPTTVTGKTVEVRTATGALVASGTF